jgi:segregation and condensation protein B
LKLSPPALETLTIVAYRQPLTRADIEALRGVQSAEILKHLMERGLIRIVGEDNSLGRPYLYGTTRQFLEHYGLRSLDELPNADQLRRQTAARAVLRVAAADTEAGAAAEDAADRSRAA